MNQWKITLWHYDALVEVIMPMCPLWKINDELAERGIHNNDNIIKIERIVK